MGIGVSVFLIALGAILAFAVQVDLSGLDIQTVGYILMFAGVVGLVLAMVVWGPRRRRGAEVEERRVYDDPRL